MTFFVWIIGIAGIAASAWCIVYLRAPILVRIIQALLPVAAAGLLFMVIARVVQTSTGEWNDAKLAPIVAMTRGYPLYSDPATGLMSGWIYGPVSALVLLPAALAAHPTTAGIIGSAIAAFCYFAPTAWLLLRASHGRLTFLVLAALLVVGWRAVSLEDLCRAAFIAGPDGIALGLATLACAAIYFRRTWLTMSVSALAVIFCFWTKHSFAPLLVGLAAYIAIADGLKRCASYLVLLGVAGAIISLLMILPFNTASMWYHMVSLPRSHPFDVTRHSLFTFSFLSALEMLLICSVALSLLVMVLLLDRLFLPPARGIRIWLASRPWSMLIIVALVLAPLSLTSYMKVGGYVNNLAATNHFSLLAALAGLIHSCARDADPFFDRTRAFLESALALFAILLGLQIMIGTTNGAADMWPLVCRPYENNNEKVFEFARAHSGQVFCPWNPLVTLMADGKLYHFEWGFLDELNARHAPNSDRLRNHLPAQAKWIVYLRRPQSTVLHESLGSHRRRIELSELPGCIVFVD